MKNDLLNFEKKINTNLWKNRFDKITYGLIYPAFIGNMIYDLFLGKKALSGKPLLPIDFYICITMIIFLIIDYMHLQGDMAQIVDTPNKKTWRYILCDIGTSILIFSSFVFFKEDKYIYGLISFLIIPAGILYYKWKNIYSRKYFIVYTLLSTIIAFFIILNNNNNSSDIKFYIFYYTLINTLFYIAYLFYYAISCQEYDVEYINKGNKY